MSGVQVAAVPSNPAPAAGALAFQNFGCMSSVVPRVLKDGTVHVELGVELSWLDVPPAPPAPPQIAKASTGKIFACLRLGETLAVAGLAMRGRGVKTLKAPLLSDLPAIGSWFTYSHEREIDEELIVLVTPRVLGKQ